MKDKIKYPTEAFALALVLFSGGMKAAMLTGICLIFGDVLLGVFREYSGKRYGQTLGTLGAVLTCGTLYAVWMLAGMTPESWQVAGFAVLGLLLVKHHEKKYAVSAIPDYNKMLCCDACAYGIYVLAAAVREYLSGAAVFEYALPKAGFVSAFFGKAAFALILAGLAVALINRILKASTEGNAALWTAVPIIILEVPFVWNNVPEWAGMLVGIVTVGVVYLTLRQKLVYAETAEHIKGVPVEMVMLGMIYMIFGLL